MVKKAAISGAELGGVNCELLTTDRFRDRDTSDRTLALRSESGPPFLVQVNFDDSAGTVSSQRGFSLEYLQIPC